MNSPSSEHAAQMLVFDRLPKSLRNFLANARMNYNSKDVWALYTGTFFDERETLNIMRQEDGRYATK